MSVTYYVALPFVPTEGGIAAGQAQECTNEGAAMAHHISTQPSVPSEGTNVGTQFRFLSKAKTDQYLRTICFVRRPWHLSFYSRYGQ